MTRKEIEKRCLEEMQQTIPDHEALWQRIEAELPPQEQRAEEQSQPIRMHTMRRAVTIAACLLIAVTGTRVLTQNRNVKENTMSESTDGSPQKDNAAENAAAENEGEAPLQQENNAPEDAIRTYASLGLPVKENAVQVQDPRRLTAGTQLFHEESVLSQTECFADVIVSSGIQRPESGEVVYLLEVVDAYGTDELQAGDTFYLYSSTPYLLQAEHEYVLPLYESGSDWRLVNGSAPQLELTHSGEVVYHNGWRTLAGADSEPLLYEQYGTDDYFYDRMYITQDAVLYGFLADWEASAHA